MAREQVLGSRSASRPPISSSGVRSPVRTARSAGPPMASSRSSAAASTTPGHSRRACSTSPISTRKPLILTWSSIRPR
ncbi:hypothetical protein ADK38_02435 [Streptomyces varsoviensis]|uniref:Uncharacterized protein n=1 Tax=Streptomyces varsoviensis TaxID=67373 RepID=A0ABR5JDY5_9ACTN|nr:hypothetical protein ADK38_02435 [Streptomyces varsoviensis]